MQPKINRDASQKSRRTCALRNQQNVMQANRMCFEMCVPFRFVFQPGKLNVSIVCANSSCITAFNV